MSKKNLTVKEIESYYQDWKEKKKEETKLKEQLKEKEKEIAALEKILFSAVPDNNKKGTVFHKVTYGKSVSYAKAIEEARTLIPKTKQKQVDNIIKKHTKVTERHTLKEEGE